MNFTPDMLALVLSGQKTQTRRPVKPNDYATFLYRYNNDFYAGFPTPNERIAELCLSASYNYSIYLAYVTTGETLKRREKYREGKTYSACPGRGKHAVCRYRLLSIRYESPAVISEDDARAEGFSSSGAFFDKLRSLYGANVDLTAPYWALTFELVKP